MVRGLTRDDAIRIATLLELPAPFLCLAAGERPDGKLGEILGPAAEFYLCTAEEQETFQLGEFVPLWDDGSFYEVVAAEPSTRLFIVFDVEDPSAPKLRPRFTYQQVLLSIFIRLYELEISDEEFRSLANDLGFKGADKVIAGYRDLDLSTSEKHKAWSSDLLARLGG